ncbi:MAG: hypothetical protein KDC07_09410, partial [Chitinophagaceae bacterium]|nr:hypothetical protein [Chitinophagaceae bacterium]
MPKITSAFAKFVLLLLISTLILGVLSSWAYLYPRHFNDRLPFYQLRPIHTSSALFFIISGAVLCIISFSKAALGSDINSTTLRVYI